MFGKRKNKPCNHKFVDKGVVVVMDKHIRMVQVCKNCGLAVHRKVYSLKEI